ncbi:MAG: monofunctional biosynthetic peptidoglycan transglycosylase [Nitrospirota bacterium]
MPVPGHLKRLLLISIITLFALLSIYIIFMPDIKSLRKENPAKTRLMEYREKEWKGRGREIRLNQIWVPLSQISPYLIKAVLIAEDDKFWRHEGFDYEAIKKAVEKDIKAKKFKFGGSTISQQLSKNLYLSPSKNPLRKAAEAIITWRIEKALSKKRILEIYLNVIEWGEGIFGAEAASRHYFGKPASALTPEEASRLAAVLPNPRKYNPGSEQRYVINRSELIYSIMVRRGVVIPEYKEAFENEHSGEDRPNEQAPDVKGKTTD